MHMTSLIKIDTQEAPRAIGPYSQAVKTGSHVFVSGQLPIDPLSGKLVEREIRQQTLQVLKNLEAVLKAAGCSLSNVVRTDVFLKDLKDFGVLNEEYAKYFTHETPPARQTIQVAALPLDALVEISCIAVLS